MFFLPVVERELRVAARKRSSFRLRVVAALVAVVIGSGGFVVLALLGRAGVGSAGLGHGLFALLTWLSFAAALSAGLFFTSDCLSEEKREGTLGFLFLTDLRGYDVVLGKLLATSLRCAYALLAIFPILATTLLLGGVTGGQFWVTLLALGNALLMSLAAGMFASAISRDSQIALGATLFLLCVLVAVGPMIDAILAGMNGRGFSAVLSLTSPGFLFRQAGAWGQPLFWPALLGNQLVTWTLFALASWLLPHTWQDRPKKRSTGKDDRAYAWRFGADQSRRALRRKLIEPNPTLWLACRERWQSWAAWLLAVLMAGGFVLTFASEYREVLAIAWGSLGSLVTLAMYLGIASHASRFMVEARRSGLMELLLATPLTPAQIVRGQWSALLRMFGAPLAVLLAAHWLGTVLTQQMTWSRIAAFTPPTPAVTIPTATNTTVVVTNSRTVTTFTTVGVGGAGTTVMAGGFTQPSELVELVVSLASTVMIAANLVVLSWVGMWMGLNSKNNSLATLKTFVFVQVIPWFVVSFATMLIVGLLLVPSVMRGGPAATQQMMSWFAVLPPVVASGLNLIKDVAFTLWARRKLYSEFRERAVPIAAPVYSSPSPPVLRSDLPAAVGST